MPTEHTSLKITAPAGDSTTTNELVIGKSNTYQRIFLIVAGSLLASLVLISVVGTSGGHYLQSSTAHEISKGAVAFVDYQVDSTNVALTKNIFGLAAFSEKDGCPNEYCKAYTNKNPCCCGGSCLCGWCVDCC